jgi:predicted secreted protein
MRHFTRSSFSRCLLGCAVMLALSACGGTDKPVDTGNQDGATDGFDPAPARQLVRSTAEPPGLRCPLGGVRIGIGTDDNGNGVLDSGEADESHTVCQADPPPLEPPWVEVETDAVMKVNTGYVATHASGTLNLQLPEGAEVGDTVRITGAGGGDWRIQQGEGQTILIDGLPAEAVSPRWTSLGSSAPWPWMIRASFDGQRLAALLYAPGHIQTSDDGGRSWTSQASSPVQTWSGLAMSDDGLHMAAVAWAGQIHTSHDAGRTWIAHDAPGTRHWTAVVMSGDGRAVVAITEDGHLHRSADGGASWQAPTQVASGHFYGLAASSDTTRLIAAGHNGPVYTSVDGGTVWTAQAGAGQRNWFAVASSADGIVLAAGDDGGELHLSTDGGIHWIAQAALGAHDLWTLAVSADGARLVANNARGTPMISADRGATWLSAAVTNMDPVMSIGASGDGLTLFAANDRSGAVLGGRIPQQTTPGRDGSLSAGPYDAITLQYLGEGRWTVLSHSRASGAGFRVS